MAILRSKKTLIMLMIGVLVAVCAAIYAANAIPSSGSNGLAEADTVSAEGAYAFDVKDEKQLVGGSTDVFIGRVVEQNGNEARPSLGSGSSSPQTQFNVEVQDVIKGDATGTVTVNQQGGYADSSGPKAEGGSTNAQSAKESNPEQTTTGAESTEGGNTKDKARKKRVMVNDDPPLETGQEYLFATNYEEDKGWYTIVGQPFGDVKVKDTQKRQELKDKFEKAKTEEIEPDFSWGGDVKDGG